MPEPANLDHLQHLVDEHHRTAFMDRETRSAGFHNMQDAAGRALPALLAELRTLRASSAGMAALYAGDQDAAERAVDALPDEELAQFGHLARDLSTIANHRTWRRHA